MPFQYSQVSWLPNTNIYEVNVRQYTPEGTFNAFAKHLPRLQQMGVQVLWFMPITPIGVKERLGSLGSYYACSSYTKINPEFGTITDFKNLVQQAHNLGLYVIIDWVANHTAHDHEWTFSDKNYYALDSNGNFTERNGWKDVIDLNYNNVKLHDAMIKAMQFWIDTCHIDGFRCDMAHLVPLPFWQKARTACDAIKPLLWLAECEEVSYHDVFDISYGWHFMHETEKYTKQEANMQHIMQVLHSYSQYPNHAHKLLFTSNHDENSWNGTEFEKYGKAAQAFAVLCCTWQRSIPLVYSGQEAANSKRLAFFDKDVIDWNKGFVLEHFYSTLLQLRTKDVIAKGELFILPTNNNSIVAYARKYKENVLLVIINIGNENGIKLTIQHPWITGKFVNVFSTFSYIFNQQEQFELMAGDYLVYEQQA